MCVFVLVSVCTNTGMCSCFACMHLLSVYVQACDISVCCVYMKVHVHLCVTHVALACEALWVCNAVSAGVCMCVVA